MPRLNRVDPFGDLHAISPRGMFTGNRGCLVDEWGSLRRHHVGSLWIICETKYKDWEHPLDSVGTWTPLFFLDDAVGLAAGHRPCGLCRRKDYLSYRAATTKSSGLEGLRAPDLNRMLAAERLRRGRGLERASDRITWTASIDDLPSGTVIVDAAGDDSYLLGPDRLQRFTFAGWEPPIPRPAGIDVGVLTPPTSVAAITAGFVPSLHPTAAVAPDA